MVAFPDPGDDASVQAVGAASGYEIIPAAAGRYEIQHAIDSVFGPAVPMLHAEDRDVHPVEDEVEGTHVNDLLVKVLEQQGSDLHLTVGSPPVIRVHGELQPVEGIDRLSGSEIREMIYAILTQKQREKFENELELDCSYSLPGQEPVPGQRVPAARQRRCCDAGHPLRDRALRRLGRAATVRTFAELPRGLVLVTGPTGSGKSTTLASLIDIVNREKALHIMTVEDPIEFLHQHKRAVVNQREVGEDTKSFAEALAPCAAPGPRRHPGR